MNTSKSIPNGLTFLACAFPRYNRPANARIGWLASMAIIVFAAAPAFGNGGPFVVKYPGGDPAAKGVLARLDPGLQPARESRLAVTRENLTIRFDSELRFSSERDQSNNTPLVSVMAEYFITNTTMETVEVDFGFPILRGIYISPFSMTGSPEARVSVDRTNHIRPAIISNSSIYGLLRARAAETIDKAVKADPELERLFTAVQSQMTESQKNSRKALADYLTTMKHWPAGDAALLLEYATLKPAGSASPGGSIPFRGEFTWGSDPSVYAATTNGAWAVAAIGEQKATQWLTQLAKQLDPDSAASYEAIFQSWGGDVRERSVDVTSGQVRPREITLANPPGPASYAGSRLAYSDPTVYARMDYLSGNKNLTEAQKESWQTVIKHLPVVFTFAPMNLLHYRVTFAPGASRTVQVSYGQQAYLDTRDPRSYQIAYVIHPASLWDSFGPIQLTVTVPKGVTPRASVALREEDAAPALTPNPYPGSRPPLSYATHVATLTEKTGELFVGIDAAAWNEIMKPPAPEPPQPAPRTAAR